MVDYPRVTHPSATNLIIHPSEKFSTIRSVRLACVKHAASVRPEPGSNSPIKIISTYLSASQILIEQFVLLFYYFITSLKVISRVILFKKPFAWTWLLTIQFSKISPAAFQQLYYLTTFNISCQELFLTFFLDHPCFCGDNKINLTIPKAFCQELFSISS